MKKGCIWNYRWEGPDHDKVFISQVKIDGKPAGKGKGKTKKEAEQMAAKETIKTLENKWKNTTHK